MTEVATVKRYEVRGLTKMGRLHFALPYHRIGEAIGSASKLMRDGYTRIRIVAVVGW